MWQRLRTRPQPALQALAYRAGMRLITSLDRWRVTLQTGAEIEVWADGYTEEGGRHVFGVLADVDPDEHDRLAIGGKTPSDPRRVIVTLAVIPSDQIATVRSA